MWSIMWIRMLGKGMVYIFYGDKYYCRMSLPILYECVISYMLRVNDLMLNVLLSLWCNVGVWSIFLNDLYVSCSWLEGYCECVFILWGDVFFNTKLIAIMSLWRPICTYTHPIHHYKYRIFRILMERIILICTFIDFFAWKLYD